ASSSGDSCSSRGCSSKALHVISRSRFSPTRSKLEWYMKHQGQTKSDHTSSRTTGRPPFSPCAANDGPGAPRRPAPSPQPSAVGIFLNAQTDQLHVHELVDPVRSAFPPDAALLHAAEG